MLDPKLLDRTVDEHRRAYGLLQWIGDAYRRGRFSPLDVRHACDSNAASTARWLDLHYATLPSANRPVDREPGTLRRFANLLSSYLEVSFDLDSNPGVREVPYGGSWCCSMCAYLVELSSLRPKKPTGRHKARAEQLKIECLQQLALNAGVTLSEEAAERICADHREDAALVTYGRELLRRAEGHVEGPAVLVLWRQFAWTREGSPKKEFELKAEAISTAESRLTRRIRSREVLLEGYTAEEILEIPAHDLDAWVLTGDPVIFRIGSASVLGQFLIREKMLVVELAQIDGGGEGVLPLLWNLAPRVASARGLRSVEWVIHAVTCAKPNLKLRRVLERKGFVVQNVPSIGKAYYLIVPV